MPHRAAYLQGFVLPFLKNPPNIFSTPYVDVAVKAHSFFAGWVGREHQTYQSLTGNQFLLCKILSVSVRRERLPSAVFWHFVAAFFLKNRAFIELLVILGSQSSWLVILWELGVRMSMLLARRVCDDTFEIWISPSCFYTRTLHLTLLKVSLRWGRKLSPSLLCSSLEFSVPVIPHGCHSRSSPVSPHGTLTTLSVAPSPLFQLPAASWRRRREVSGEEIHGFPFAIRSGRIMKPPPPRTFHMHESGDEIRKCKLLLQVSLIRM